jgi:hypothetical protein
MALFKKISIIYSYYTMASEIELTKIRDEVFRKIGRNLLNFQKIEFKCKKSCKTVHLP